MTTKTTSSQNMPKTPQPQPTITIKETILKTMTIHNTMDNSKATQTLITIQVWFKTASITEPYQNMRDMVTTMMIHIVALFILNKLRKRLRIYNIQLRHLRMKMSLLINHMMIVSPIGMMILLINRLEMGQKSLSLSKRSLRRGLH